MVMPEGGDMGISTGEMEEMAMEGLKMEYENGRGFC
jgi:hypothetical protein